MADQKRKIEMIRRIKNLKLSNTLIAGLDDAGQAEAIAEAVSSLQNLTEQWNCNNLFNSRHRAVQAFWQDNFESIKSTSKI